MKFLRDVLNLVLLNFMVLSILGLFLIIHAGLRGLTTVFSRLSRARYNCPPDVSINPPSKNEASKPKKKTKTSLALERHLITSIYLAIQYNTIQYNTIQYNTIQYNTIQYNTIQYNTIQYNTIQTLLTLPKEGFSVIII